MASITDALSAYSATAKTALNSVSRGPLGDWWREGVKRVRIIGD